MLSLMGSSSQVYDIIKIVAEMGAGISAVENEVFSLSL